MGDRLPEKWKTPPFIAALQTPEATQLEWWPGTHDMDRFHAIVERLFGIKKDDFPRGGPQSPLNLKQYLELARVEEPNRKEMARLIRAGTVAVRPEHNTALALELLDPDMYGGGREKSSSADSGGREMAQSRSGGGEERKPKREAVRLRVGREEAASLLKGCLDEVKEHYLPDVVMKSFPEPIKTKIQTWTHKCEAILTRVFGAGQVVDDFDEIGTPFFSREDFMKRYKKLLGLQDSLPYYEQASPPAAGQKISDYSTSKVFVVHGHDDGLKHEVARYLESIGLVPVILHEQASKGKTIIEKLEHYSDVGFAVVLITPDDVGGAAVIPPAVPALRPRARQNVILELGYFIGLLGRERVCALRKGDLEEPGDVLGVVYLKHEGNWKVDLVKELDSVPMAVKREGMK